MIFVCGTVQGHAPDIVNAALGGMSAARRVAHGRPLTTVQLAGGALAHAACTVAEASAGATTAWLFRPGGEDRAADGAVLGGVAQAYAESGRLAPRGLAGAFLLVMFDGAAQRVLLATDRFATCPLYYRVRAGQFSFASDPAALLAHPAASRALDTQAIYDYVFFHCIPSPRTIYQGVSKLGPAQALRWDGSAAQVATYWLPEFAATDDGPDRLGASLLETLEGAVGRRVRPRCGAFLSGGLDSSSVAGMLKRTSGAAATFTIGFDAAGYDESGYARIAARHFDTDHHEYFVTPADVLESLPRIAAHYGEPFGNSSVIPTYHCARLAREHGVDLMLAGDGGDELFAGNTRYVEQRRFELYFRMPSMLRAALESGYRLLPFLHRLPIAGKGARYIQQARMGLPDRLQSYNFLHRFDPGRVFVGEWLATVDTEAPWRTWRERYAAPAAGDALQRMLYLDWKFTLADNDLVKVSNMCELAGVEVCYPMLDDALVDLAASVSSPTLLAGGELRGFYKRACADFLPGEILTKSKHGFGLPFGVWMREDQGLKTLVADALAALRERDIVRREFIDEAQRLYREEAAAGYYGELVWVLTMLELWFAAHGF